MRNLIRKLLFLSLLLVGWLAPPPAAALVTGMPLRATFTAMAEDSTRWGASAARAALNQYAGTAYAELAEGEEEADDMQRTTPQATDAVEAPARRAFILLAPNPSNGHVRVGYGLERAAKTVELRVYDQWGQPMGAYTLTDEALTEGVTLKLRAGIYHCVLVADGAVVAKERLLITK